jgi:multiple antibiotic resistance protein
MDWTFIYSTAMLLLMLTDPFGNLPVFLATLKPVPKCRQPKVLFRELCIALVAMILALTFGRSFFGLLQIEGGTLSIAGGLILLLTGIKMVFSTLVEVKEETKIEPFIVPMAIPLICGPGVIAILSTLCGSLPQATYLNCLCALLIAWVLQTLILCAGHRIARHLDKRVLNAIESLMGLLLVCLAVGLLLRGINQTYGL